MTRNDLFDSLNLNGNYLTSSKPSQFSKIFPSLSFYLKFIKIQIFANRLARHGKMDDQAFMDTSYYIFHALEKSGIKFNIDKIENLKLNNEPAVFISNHISTLETMILPCIIYPFKPIAFIMKKELTTYPVFGKVASAVDPIVVGRSNPREDLMTVLQEGTTRIGSGKSLIIFPQRTRELLFDSTKFNSLGVKLAKKANAQIIPLALATDAWGNGNLVKDFGKIEPAKTVRFAFGEPFKVEDSAESQERIINFIESQLNEWGRSDLIKEN